MIISKPFIPTAAMYQTVSKNINMDKNYWMTVFIPMQNSNHYVYDYLPSSPTQCKQDHFRSYIKLMINMQEIPEDYQIGDKFKVNDNNLTWIYAGYGLAVSEKDFGPCEKENVDITVLQTGCVL